MMARLRIFSLRKPTAINSAVKIGPMVFKNASMENQLKILRICRWKQDGIQRLCVNKQTEGNRQSDIQDDIHTVPDIFAYQLQVMIGKCRSDMRYDGGGEPRCQNHRNGHQL